MRVSRDGRRITPLTAGSYDELWTEPRWSHTGDFIVASRWLRGNISQIVVVDTTDRIVHTVSSGTSIEATPSWLRDDAGILYSSDRHGSAQLYVEEFAIARRLQRRTHLSGQRRAATGLFEPNASPDVGQYGSPPCCSAATDTTSALAPAAPQARAPARVRPSSAPSHTSIRLRDDVWRPSWSTAALRSHSVRGVRCYRTTGCPPSKSRSTAATGSAPRPSGVDVIGRHAFTARLAVPTNGRGGVVGGLTYQYAGLGLPILQFDASQDWQSLGGIFARNPQRDRLGELFRRYWNADALATWIHQRYRTSTTLTGGTGIERWSHATSPRGLIPLIDTTGRFGTINFPSLIAGATFANYQRPQYSVSPEDGIQLTTTVRDRLYSGFTGTGGQSISTVGSAELFKSIDLPGFAHHVLALARRRRLGR